MKKKLPTQIEIAKILRVSQSTVSKYANGILCLSWENAQLLKKEFKLTDNDINSFISKNIQKTKPNEKV
ncbi:helix-turn-helix domain-containing protein [Aliarcobacter lanthieri]|uniref:helix-turn-helix domain-containing protein n=1 Tax=Aliarcobacter lanthieri TaxID=1355374 RepID=UPI003AA980E2